MSDDNWITIPLEVTPGVIRALQHCGFVPVTGEITVHTVAAGIVGVLGQLISKFSFYFQHLYNGN
jgi:hypothetical protein